MSIVSTVLALALAILARVPVLLWGPPGAGKSSAVRALGSALGLPVEVVIASIREPSDFAGLPVLHDGEVRFAPPAWARRLAQAGKGILFLDEISTAPPAVQAALLRVVLDRVVGDLELPEGVAVVAAANPPEQAAGGWDLAPPLANRFVHLEWRLDAAAWVDGMVQGWAVPAVPALPVGWEAGIPAARALVAAFIRARPHLLLQVPREESQAGRAWPSPRTWDMAARLLAAAQAAEAGQEVEAELLAGCVGQGAALEFLGWRRSLDLPDPEELLRDPASYRHPARGDQAFAVLAAVAAAVVARPSRERWVAAWEIIAQAVRAGGPDVAAVAARSLVTVRRPDWPVPVEAVRSLAPVLKGAGLL